MYSRVFGVNAIFLALVLTAARGQGPGDRQKIEGLIKHIEGLKDAKFVRNDTEYDAKTAATFLRRKWQRDSSVKTAADFVDKVASVSSTSGKPYLIRFKDGKETKSGDYLRAELKKLDKPGP
jgi:hypothetical protein